MEVGKWLELWYTTYVESRPDLAQSTKAMYRRAVHAVPSWLGAASLGDPLLPLHITRWLTMVGKATPRAAQLDRVMLSRALCVAGKLGLCPQGIIDKDTVPKPPHRPREAAILTMEQARAYKTEAQSHTCYVLLMLCLCGLRRGEALGARWADWDGQALHIRQQRLRIAHEYSTAPLKTERSARALVLPAWLAADLERMPRSITGWIHDTTPEALQKDHLHVIEAAGLPHVTLHGLRHTYATAAALQGRAMKDLQLSLGHSKIAITADLYADHLDPLSALPAQVWRAL